MKTSVDHLADALSAGEHEVPINGFVVEVVECQFCPAKFTKLRGSQEKYCNPCRKRLTKTVTPTLELKRVAKLRMQ